MTEAPTRYPIYDQKMLALISALIKWRRLLMPAEVPAYTDHRALQYLFKLKADKPVRAREARWWDFLADFQGLKVEYKPGAHNIVADALSRCPYYHGPIQKEEFPQEGELKGKVFKVCAVAKRVQPVQAQPHVRRSERLRQKREAQVNEQQQEGGKKSKSQKQQPQQQIEVEVEEQQLEAQNQDQLPIQQQQQQEDLEQSDVRP